MFLLQNVRLSYFYAIIGQGFDFIYFFIARLELSELIVRHTLRLTKFELWLNILRVRLALVKGITMTLL